MSSLKKLNNPLSNVENQIKVLSDKNKTSFASKLGEIGMSPLKPINLDTLQINLGKMCNQECKHCHVDAGPDRKEIMTRETMQYCLDVIQENSIKIVDLTGGAPEMNPDFRWFVESIRAISTDIKIIVRCNLTIILANKKYHDLPLFFKENQIEVVSSLPYFAARRTDAQRGDGVFDKSIKALQLLNEVGYGTSENLILNLVYNPTGTFLPASQSGLEKEFKSALDRKFGIKFNSLFAITNLPVSRFLDYLIQTDKYEEYLDKLIEAYNPTAAENVMCRSMISVSWDGYLYDCDFNQMLDMKLSDVDHIKDYNGKTLLNRKIKVLNHCYGCTAGAGSSCGGEVV